VNSALCALACGAVLALAAPAMLRQAMPAAWWVPRCGVFAWQLCSFSVIASWVVAALLATNLVVGVTIAALVMGRLGWAVASVAAQERRRRRQHLEAVRFVGHTDEALGVTVVETAVPAVYCVAGRPHTIVVTSAARALLGARHLAAVLAHERAHLAGRHHLALVLARGFTRAFGPVPLFRAAEREIAFLLEVLADDAAARRHGRTTVAQALLGLACGRPAAAVPAGAMHAAGSGVVARVQRLLTPPHPPRLGETLRRQTALVLVATAPLLLVAVPMALLATHFGDCSMHVL
jgi:Zn-dependent protease with chaperone function